MLNNEKIIGKYNEVYATSYDLYDPDILESIVDLDLLGVSEEDIMKVIESGKCMGINDALNAEFIKKTLEEPKKSNKRSRKKAEPDQNNPFGMFEQAITQVVGQQAEPMIESIVEDRLNDWVKENSSRIVVPIEYELPDGSKFDEVTHEKFEQVCKFVGLNLPLMLVGPAGTGKNHLCKQVADAFNLEFYFANAVTQEYKLTGFIDANGVYHETQFFKAFTQGGLFMFDELDASDPEVLVIFNAALANGYFDFPTGREYANENFRVIAAANTTGNGASYEYVGRNQLDAATLNRFGLIRIGYSERIENAMTDDNDLLDFVRSFRKACDEYGINHVASYRDITRCSLLKSALGYLEALRTGLVRNLEQDDMNMLVNKFNDKLDDWSSAFCELARGC